MQTPDHHEFLRKELQDKLSPEEQARLRKALAERTGSESAEEEFGLNRLLRQLPDVPLSSNFTSLVLRRAERESRARPLPSWAFWPPTWTSWDWIRGSATVLVLLGVGGLSVYQYQLSRRQQFARNVATISRVVTRPTLEMLVDFDAIRRLGQVPPAPELELQKVDRELLAAIP